MRINFDLLKFNLKLIYHYYYFNYNFYEYLFKRFMFMCDSNLKIISFFKKSLSSNLFNYL